MRTLPADAQQLYRLRFSEKACRQKAVVWKIIVENFFQRWIGPQDTVLDLGCGYGEFLNHVRSARRIGVDLNPDSRAHLAPQIEFHAGDVTDLSFLEDQSVDVAFTSNLLEHLPGKDDVKHLLTDAHRVLKPGGQFIALGPNLRFLPGEYWDFWDHCTPITDRSLVEVLESVGFTILTDIARFLPYTTRSALPKAGFLVRLYLSVPLAWRILGKQFLVRAGKAASNHAME
jgi:SAM-dependent methyltransferase